MKRVDRIIRFLSGEMNRDEEEKFKNDCIQDNRLREEAEEASRVWEMIREQILESDEEEFRGKLIRAMNTRNKSSHRRIHPLWILLALAASLLLLIFLMQRDAEPEILFAEFYSPKEDVILQSLQQETRGDSSSCALLYSKASFQLLYDRCNYLLAKDPGNQLYRLYQILAIIELGYSIEDQNPGPDWHEADTSSVSGRALLWYQALESISKGKTIPALEQLELLAGTSGPYSKEAGKLHKRLLK